MTPISDRDQAGCEDPLQSHEQAEETGKHGAGNEAAPHPSRPQQMDRHADNCNEENRQPHPPTNPAAEFLTVQGTPAQCEDRQQDTFDNPKIRLCILLGSQSVHCPQQPANEHPVPNRLALLESQGARYACEKSIVIANLIHRISSANETSVTG
ncbi:MAG: hypothetical protein H7062_25840 [Candidatus Saccharimonas sp.]|nr:hypothetical protein [Planctomycetaceae bacterium]